MAQVPVTLKRGQIAQWKYPPTDTVTIDVTVKSAKHPWRELAPTWDMVLGIKNGTMLTAEYHRQYGLILDKVSLTTWREVYDTQKTVMFLCYCRDGEFCHTHLLIDRMTTKWPERFRDGRTPAGLPQSEDLQARIEATMRGTYERLQKTNSPPHLTPSEITEFAKDLTREVQKWKTY